MNKLKCIFYVFIILFFIHYLTLNIESFVPNEKQFSVCENTIDKGETYYQIYNNNIVQPLTGFFSSAIDLTDENNLSKYFKPPQCHGTYQTNRDYFNDNKIIDTSENTWEPLKDPFDKYYGPLDNYAVLYSEEHNEDFLERKRQNVELDDRY